LLRSANNCHPLYQTSHLPFSLHIGEKPFSNPKLVQEEPTELFDPLERAQMQAIGIEKGKPFNPDEKMKAGLYPV